MKTKVWAIGKTKEKWLQTGIEAYQKKLKHYLKLEYEEFRIKSARNRSATLKQESDLLLSKIGPDDFLILLDEKGESLSSALLAQRFQTWQNHSLKTLVFVIGGPFGHTLEIKTRANAILSLSAMTFTHDMARLILLEQIYRSMTILKNEPYHNV